MRELRCDYEACGSASWLFGLNKDTNTEFHEKQQPIHCVWHTEAQECITLYRTDKVAKSPTVLPLKPNNIEYSWIVWDQDLFLFLFIRFHLLCLKGLRALHNGQASILQHSLWMPNLQAIFMEKEATMKNVKGRTMHALLVAVYLVIS